MISIDRCCLLLCIVIVSSCARYVGNLAERVNEALLWEIFNTVGRVETLKIIRDKQSQQSLCYGFVDYFTHYDAMQALTLLNGVDVYGSSLKVNWALAGGQRDGDTSSHHHIFIGDLSTEISDVGGSHSRTVLFSLESTV